MGLTLEEIMEEDVTVTQKQAMKEVNKHGVAWEEFTKDNGVHDVYSAQKVLLWLGY